MIETYCLTTLVICLLVVMRWSPDQLDPVYPTTSLHLDFTHRSIFCPGPMIWNDLGSALQSIETMHRFKTTVKTCCSWILLTYVQRTIDYWRMISLCLPLYCSVTCPSSFCVTMLTALTWTNVNSTQIHNVLHVYW